MRAPSFGITESHAPESAQSSISIHSSGSPTVDNPCDFGVRMLIHSVRKTLVDSARSCVVALFSVIARIVIPPCLDHVLLLSVPQDLGTWFGRWYMVPWLMIIGCRSLISCPSFNARARIHHLTTRYNTWIDRPESSIAFARAIFQCLKSNVSISHGDRCRWFLRCAVSPNIVVALTLVCG